LSCKEGDLIEHYRIERKLASGGMGEVYLAVDSKLGREVVLKTLGVQFISDELLKLRFINEAQTTATLNHANIVTVFEVAEYENQAYMVMEYVKGRTVAELIARGSLNPSDSLDIFIQICQGLIVAHKSGVTHRDIKPDNIIVDEEGRVKIVDFGLARLEGADHITKTGALVGTVGYMSPEQGQGMRTDFRTDIFSAGVVLQEMLTGQNPFQRDSMAATIHAIVCEPPSTLPETENPFSESLQTVLDRALAKNCPDRYQSMSEFLDDLLEIRKTGGLTRKSATLKRKFNGRTPTLAVLQLQNPGGDDDKYLCYGITDGLIVDLTRIGAIRVVPMRKILKLQQSDYDIDDIAKHLEADYVLDGSLHRNGDNIRVSAQLIETESGKSVWAEMWETTFEHIQEIRQKLADGTAGAMDISKSIIRNADIRTPIPVKPEAYEYYLKAKYAFERRQDSIDSDAALRLYKKALTEDDSFLAAQVGIAQIYMHRNEHERACRKLLEVLTEAKRRNSRADEAMILRTLTHTQIVQSRWERGMKFAQQALEISRSIDDLAGESETLDIEIQILTNQAKFSEAIELLGRVLEINNQLGDHMQTARALQTMGFLHIRRGDYIRSQALSNKALKIAREKGFRSVEAMCLKNIGITWEYMGKLDRAREHYKEAYDIFSAIGDDSGRAACINNTANVHYAQGDYRKSMEYFEQAAGIQKNAGNQASYVLSYNNMATPAVVVGEYDKAIAVSRESMDLAQKLDYPLVIHDAANCLGFAYFLKDNIEKAELYFNIAMDTAQKGAIRRCESMTSAHLAEMYYHLGKILRSQEEADRAILLGKENNVREFELKASLYKAAIDYGKTSGESDLNKLRELINETEEHGDPRYIAAAHRLLGEMLVNKENKNFQEEGLEHLNKGLKLADQYEIIYEKIWIETITKKERKSAVKI